MRRRIVAFTVVAFLAGATGASAQLYAPQSLEGYFRLEWQVAHGRKGVAIEGYVVNKALRGAERVRLQIERLDDAGRVVGSSIVWVLGNIPTDGRAFFSASVPEAATYRVQVLSFDWSGGGGPGGGGM